MKALIEAEIANIRKEIEQLEDVAARLTNLLDQATDAEATPPKKKRGRKPKHVGLPDDTDAIPKAKEVA